MTREDRYAQLQDKFDVLSEGEKDFITWCAIDRLTVLYADELNKKHGDIYYRLYLQDALTELKKVEAALAYKVF